MNNETDPSTSPRSAEIPHLEIRNFEISIGGASYWIAYEGRHYPVILTPYHLVRMFEIEGLDIKSFTGDEPLLFTKAVLHRSGYKIGGDVFDEEGEDITPQPCWVMEEDMEKGFENPSRRTANTREDRA